MSKKNTNSDKFITPPPRIWRGLMARELIIQSFLQREKMFFEREKQKREE
jgi:hypothetical protein